VTLGALFGVAAALGLIVALLGLSVRALRRYTGVANAKTGRLDLEVVARIGVGPRQGLAVVKVGGRGVVISVGEGGVRPILELTPEECTDYGLGEEHDQARQPFDIALSRASERESSVLTRFVEKIGGRPLSLLLIGFIGLLSLVAQPSELVASSFNMQAMVGPAFNVAQLPQDLGSGGGTVDDIASSLLPRLDLQLGGEGGESGLRLRGTVGTVIVIGLLTLLPTLLLLMTSFTRILVVLHFLRQALGTQSAPPAHLLAALALLLTGFVMAPTLSQMNEVALAPWVDGELEEGEMLKAAVVPLREFMLRQTPERDLGVFLEMSDSPELEGPEDVPLTVLISAFATSELRTAFQIGFAIFLPFIVIDLVVAAVLTSMGMFMLPPAMIALPCKLLLFVLVDGWSLVVQGLVTSFS